MGEQSEKVILSRLKGLLRVGKSSPSFTYHYALLIDPWLLTKITLKYGDYGGLAQREEEEYQSIIHSASPAPLAKPNCSVNPSNRFSLPTYIISVSACSRLSFLKDLRTLKY